MGRRRSGDPDLLTNLISNASKYSPDGGRITITTRRAGGFACVEIRDTGIGLSAEQQGQFFTPFFRAQRHGPDRAGDTGLGLVITRFLAELHGRQITVPSAPDQGSTFSFTLPVAQPGMEVTGSAGDSTART